MLPLVIALGSIPVREIVKIVISNSVGKRHFQVFSHSSAVRASPPFGELMCGVGTLVPSLLICAGPCRSKRSTISHGAGLCGFVCGIHVAHFLTCPVVPSLLKVVCGPSAL